MKKYLNKKYILSGTAILFALLWFMKGQGAVEGKTANPQVLATYVETVTANGQIRPKQEVFLTLRKGGLVDLVQGSINEPVKKDQILVTVDTRTNRAALERALSKYKFAGAEHSRNSRLLSSRAGTRQAYEESLNQINVARSELEEARQKLEDSIVRSPIEGVLSFLPFKIGDFVPDGSRVAVVEDRSGAELVTRVPQSNAKLFPMTKTVNLVKGSNNESIAATLSMIDPDQVSGAQDIDIRVQFQTLPTKFKFREFVDIQIPLDEYKNIAAVPAEFIMNASAKPFVFVLKNGSQLQKIELEVVSIRNGNFYVKNLSEQEKMFLPFDSKGLEKQIGKNIAIKEQKTTTKAR